MIASPTLYQSASGFPLVGWRKRDPDHRDFRLGDFMVEMPRSRLLLPTMYQPKIWPLDKLLVQDGPKCVAFTGGHWKRALPTFTPVEAAYCDDLYGRCKARDGYPNDDGTDLRTLAKALKDEGALEAYAFASSVSEIRDWVLTKGPIMGGFLWTAGMDKPDGQGYGHPTGRELGGHAFLIGGWIPVSRWTWLLDDVICPNTWGLDWNKFLLRYENRQQYFPGYFRLKACDLVKLLRRQGDALAAVELPRAK